MKRSKLGALILDLMSLVFESWFLVKVLKDVRVFLLFKLFSEEEMLSVWRGLMFFLTSFVGFFLF